MTRTKGTYLALIAVLLSPIAANADLIVLDTWNVDAIQDSGDIVTVVIDTDGNGNVTAMFQWSEGDLADGLWSAIGLDTIFYNSASDVLAVLDQDGNDVTGDWHLNFGGATGGGGFGSFLSLRNLEGGGTGGISPDSITMVFAAGTTFTDNGPPTNATFDVHIRYGNDCSGWVSDGNTNSDTSGPSPCGSTTVPEPSSLALLGLGLFGMGLARRRRKV